VKALNRRSATLLRPAVQELTAVVVGSVVQSGLVVAQAFFIAATIVALTQGTDLRTPIVGVSAIFAARACIGWLTDAAAARAASTVGVCVRRRVLERAMDPSSAGLTRQRAGGLIVLATRGVSALEPYLTRYLPALLLAAVLPALTLVVIASQDLSSAAIVAATLPLVPVFGALVGWSTATRARRQWREMAALAGYFLDVVKGLPTLVAFRRADSQVAAIRRMTSRHRIATLSTLRLGFASAAVLELVATLSVAMVAVSVGLRLAAGSLDLRTALVVLLLAPEAYWPLRRVGAEFHAAAEGRATIEKVAALLETGPKQDCRVNASPPESTIRLTDIAVTYPGRGDAALTLDELCIAPGEFVAISGATGAGKSTLLATLAGQIVPSHGRVEVGNGDLQDIDPDSWAQRVAWVPQRPWILDGSVADNVRLGRADASEAEIWAALRDVAMGDVVAAMPGGLEAAVGEGGSKLSAGERARLALARVLVARRSLVLLDEPTAHLDAVTEATVLATLRGLAGHRTVVVVAHRQAVIDAADRVIVVHPPNGQPVVTPHSSRGEAIRRSPTTELPPSRTPPPRQLDDREVEPAGRLRLAVAIMFGAAAASAGVALTGTAGWLIVRASEHPPVLTLLVAIVSVRTFGLARPLLRYVERLLAHDAALRSLARWRAEVYAALIPLTPAALGPRRGDVLTGLVDDVDAHVDRRLRVWAPCATALVTCAASIAFVWSVNRSAAAVLVGASVTAGVAGFAVSRWGAAKAEARFVDQRAELSRRVTDVLQGASELNAWGATTRVLDLVDIAGRRLARSAQLAVSGAASARALSAVATGIAIASTALVIHPAVGVSLDPATAAFLLLVPLALWEVLVPLCDAGSVSARCRHSLHRLDQLVSKPPAIQEPERPRAMPAAPVPSLHVHHAELGWDGTPVVSVGDLSLPAGRHIGVTGPSGSGKSTLAAALLRFIDPSAGSVELDSCDLRQLRAADVRRCVGLVDDDPHIFGSTLAENVRLARPDASDTQIQQALDQAHLGTWSRRLPLGLATLLGDGAAEVSGGERARIALARSVLARQPVLVLDEPTAHLDATTSRAVIRDLVDSAAGRSVVLISHRPEDLVGLREIIHLGADHRSIRAYAADSSAICAASPTLE
jgi:ATP-binding cassette subfamily C protein CydCD